jgi:hypothetical protein
MDLISPGHSRKHLLFCQPPNPIPKDPVSKREGREVEEEERERREWREF